MALMLKDGAELSFFGWIQACPLSGESSIYKINFSLTPGFVLSYDVQVAGFCCHRMPAAIKVSVLTEATWTGCTETGSAQSYLAAAAHLYSWDRETSVSWNTPCWTLHWAPNLGAVTTQLWHWVPYLQVLPGKHWGHSMLWFGRTLWPQNLSISCCFANHDTHSLKLRHWFSLHPFHFSKIKTFYSFPHTSYIFSFWWLKTKRWKQNRLIKILMMLSSWTNFHSNMDTWKVALSV